MSDTRCPTCQRYVSLADGFGDAEPGGHRGFEPIVPYCNPRCAAGALPPQKCETHERPRCGVCDPCEGCGGAPGWGMPSCSVETCEAARIARKREDGTLSPHAESFYLRSINR